MDSTALFSGRTAWFSSSCPRAHVESWVNNGGSRFSSVETAGKLRGGVDFVFLRDVEDPVYASCYHLFGSGSQLRRTDGADLTPSSLFGELSSTAEPSLHLLESFRVPLGPFLLDENHSSSSLLADIKPSHQPFKTPLRPTQSYPPQPHTELISSASPAPDSTPAQLKRKHSSTSNPASIEPLQFKKPKKHIASTTSDHLPASSHPTTPPPYLLANPNLTEPTTTPLLLLQHISYFLPPASSIPDRGCYRFGTGGLEEHRGGLGIGVFDVEGGRDGGRFEAVSKKRVKMEPED